MLLSKALHNFATCSPIHTHTHTHTHTNGIQGAGPFVAIWRFSVLPKDTWTCGQQEPGIKPPACYQWTTRSTSWATATAVFCSTVDRVQHYKTVYSDRNILPEESVKPFELQFNILCLRLNTWEIFSSGLEHQYFVLTDEKWLTQASFKFDSQTHSYCL